MSDARDTGEHIITATVVQPEFDAHVAARRVADLSSQIDFLDNEIARYRELLEHQRIRHSTETADNQLEHDTTIDELRREERRHAQALHDSYRALLAERQLEFERELSASAAANAAEFTAERSRFEEILESERARRDVIVEAGRKQAADEFNESHLRARQGLVSELTKAAATIERLRRQLDEQTSRATLAEERARVAELDVLGLQQRHDDLEHEHHARVGEIESQLTTATRRLDAERQRSAATLSDLLQRSVSIAAEADRARSEFAAEQARSTHTLAATQQQATDNYAALAAAADERASHALHREAELESLIAELRAHISPKSA